MTDIIIIICLPVIIPHYHNCIYSVHLLYTFVGVFNEILLLLLLLLLPEWAIVILADLWLCLLVLAVN